MKRIVLGKAGLDPVAAILELRRFFWIPALRFGLRSASYDPTSRYGRNDVFGRRVNNDGSVEI